ncbi:hypothetical protein KVP04_02205 [Halobacterium salinarum]|uniref:hypothetical protein n=1 Tax=Halobacterium salinarum TaxID=2242 RepID=UPI001F3D866F|nr:hypothetical protein [Halobacterium salinarum]MCF2165600.1 hypothetical protein [Halobacterium salinarum]MCF2167727.1 hypothetical protein [Halobacterium salinarum]MCF2208585.1 hypothetical protein [Halobacterium salinarum]MCF2237942.1 hypothetical protein [Halobacterium salinarum]
MVSDPIVQCDCCWFGERDFELVGSIWGAVDFGFESDEMAEEFEQDWGKEGDEFTIGIEGYSGSFDELVQEL